MASKQTAQIAMDRVENTFHFRMEGLEGDHEGNFSLKGCSIGRIPEMGDLIERLQQAGFQDYEIDIAIEKMARSLQALALARVFADRMQVI